ncbi:MAG: molybdopterin molybdotransferase MoeA [Proteobacteria bacterium]|nr:molybdopterin molybdotransferase MoeA [Pseudomonadota bacterium]MDA1309101.1 molybdopterin molybdotransferase MoeA [Pseudomonadota bacterium]
MAQLSDDCFAFGGDLTPVDEALAQLARVLVPVTEPESVALPLARGRILAEAVSASENVPPYDNSAVDGFAVYFDDLAGDGETPLPITGRAAAGHPLQRDQARGEAIRIFTGAPMPSGSHDPGARATGVRGPDTVLMQEDCRETGDMVMIPPGIRRGANRRSAGEDVLAGSIVLRPGQRLRPQEIGLAAAIGRSRLMVHTPLRAAIFSTGDEVRDPGTPRVDGTIYDSNRFTLAALLQGLGCEVDDLGILPDNRQAIAAALSAAAADHDVILTSGGVSTGGEDHVRGAVEDTGSLHFWRLAIKPGRPVALGQVGRTPFIGLPGNPVAAMVTFLRVARPLILRLAGSEASAPSLFQVRAGFSYKKKRNRREYVRVRLETKVPGSHIARKYEHDGAGILSSMVFADGLVELSEEITSIGEGDLVDYLPFSEVGL